MSYREPGVPSSTWWKSSDGRNAIRISQIRSACFYISDEGKDLPCTVTFITGSNLRLSTEEALSLLKVLE